MVVLFPGFSEAGGFVSSTYRVVRIGYVESLRYVGFTYRMLRMASPLQVPWSDEMKVRWRLEAERRGLSVAALVRLFVEDRLNGGEPSGGASVVDPSPQVSAVTPEPASLPLSRSKNQENIVIEQLGNLPGVVRASDLVQPMPSRYELEDDLDDEYGSEPFVESA